MCEEKLYFKLINNCKRKSFLISEIVFIYILVYNIIYLLSTIHIAEKHYNNANKVFYQINVKLDVYNSFAVILKMPK